MGRAPQLDTDGFPVRMAPEQAAAFFGVDVKTLNRWRLAGKLRGAAICLPSGRGAGSRPQYRYDRNKCQSLLDKWATATDRRFS